MNCKSINNNSSKYEIPFNKIRQLTKSQNYGEKIVSPVELIRRYARLVNSDFQEKIGFDVDFPIILKRISNVEEVDFEDIFHRLILISFYHN